MTQRNTIVFDFSGTLVKMRPPVLLVKKGVLENLAKRYQLGIVTGARRTETLNILTKLNIKKMFSAIISKDDTKFRKPDPKLLMIVEKKLAAKVTAYIGDSKNDRVMAKAKKVPFIFAEDFRQSKW